MKPQGILALYLILLSVTVMAQEPDSTINNSETKIQFKLGAFYNSNLNYYGRTDSLRSSGFFPVAELWLNDLFYVTAAPVFVNNSTVSFDYAGSVLTAKVLRRVWCFQSGS